MDDLSRVQDLLKTARKIAEDAKMADILLYLIAMAEAEATDQIARRFKRR